jgi:hypothetical protein
VARVEVLRWRKGTLYGRNVTGGAMNIGPVRRGVPVRGRFYRQGDARALRAYRREVELWASPTEGLDINVSYAWLDTEYTAFPSNPDL